MFPNLQVYVVSSTSVHSSLHSVIFLSLHLLASYFNSISLSLLSSLSFPPYPQLLVKYSSSLMVQTSVHSSLLQSSIFFSLPLLVSFLNSISLSLSFLSVPQYPQLCVSSSTSKTFRVLMLILSSFCTLPLLYLFFNITSLSLLPLLPLSLDLCVFVSYSSIFFSRS